MKLSQQLRGRAEAFRQDVAHVDKQLDADSGDNSTLHRSLLDKRGGYRIAASELIMFADQLERDGL